jgi:hypothetical protein
VRLLVVATEFPSGLASRLPALGVETHVLMPQAEARAELQAPTQAWVHRERHWSTTALPKAIVVARRERVGVVLTTSPSVHVIGAAVRLATRARWVADVRGHSGTVLGSLVARQADAVVGSDDELADLLRSFG